MVNSTPPHNDAPTVVSVTFAVAEFQSREEGAHVRQIAKITSDLLRAAVSLNRAYESRFESSQSISAKNYSALYRKPTKDVNVFTGAVASANRDKEKGICEMRERAESRKRVTVANSEAALRGELFPGRALVRPRIRFKNQSGEETWKECSKDYRHHGIHTPGLFTLQCVCEKPKLNGVPVMEESESPSTALTNLITRFPNIPRVTFYDN